MKEDGKGRRAAKAPAAATAARRIQRAQDTRDAAARKTEGASKKAPSKGPDPSVQAGAREQPVELPAQHLAKPGSEAELQLEAAVPGARLPRQRQARRHGGAHHRRRLRHRPRGGGAVRARRRRRRDRLPRRARGRRGDEALRRGRGPALPADPGRREGRGVLPARPSSGPCEAFGRLDVLVNNAAFQEHADSLEDITDERLDQTLRTNIYGYFHMARRRCRT